jgi:NlpC/P60 family putative phage cell wall peptidase
MTPQDRYNVVAEALTWLNTPYHPHGRVKGAGVDCIHLLIEVYAACGLVPHVAPGEYAPDWYLHRSEERYLDGVMQYAEPVEQPLPGDLVLFRFGRCVSHGAIVTAWPTVIHAYADQRRVVLTDIDRAAHLQRRLAGFYTLKG